jgi:hypothetical protein
MIVPIDAKRQSERFAGFAGGCIPKKLLLFRQFLSGLIRLIDRLSLSRHGESSSELGSVMI